MFGALKRFFGKGVCPYQFSFVLDIPFRRFILSPQTLADRLYLKEDSKVLEIGPGGGYFSIEVARRIPKGHLELLDIQQKMLEKIHQKAKRTGLNNIGFTLGDAVRMPFCEEKFDVVFMVSVLGEVLGKEECLSEIHRVLKPFGLLSITEQPGDPDFMSLPTVCSLAEKMGFKLLKVYGKGKNYTANFEKLR